MRIAMLLSAPLPPREGIGFYAWNLALCLKAQGHEVHLITRGSLRPAQPECVEGITIWRPLYIPIFPFHTHFHNLFVTQLIRKLEDDLDLLHIHTPLVMPPATRLPILVTVHTPLKADIRSVQKKDLLGLLIAMQAPFSFAIENRLFQRADRFAAVASSVGREMAEYGINPKDVTVIGNGVDADFFVPGKEQPLGQNPYFLTVGRLTVRKGLEDLIAAAKMVIGKYPSMKFVILGSGPFHKDLLRLIAANHLESNVILPGHIQDRSRLLKYYQEAFAYIHPAHYEGLPTVLLEAMACGKTVIATAVSGALDVIRDGQNGFFVPPRRPALLAEMLIKILDQPNLAAHLGQAARKTICAEFSWQVIGARYLAQYRALTMDVEHGK
jgi:glycosyltransferase involved in cell wall biosynthesis